MTEATVSLSPSDVSQLIKLLMQRRYLHGDDVSAIRKEHPCQDESREKYNDMMIAGIENEESHESSCKVILTTDETCFMTTDRLHDKLHELLESVGGRLPQIDAANLLRVDGDAIVKCLVRTNASILQVGSDCIVMNAYLKQTIIPWVLHTLNTGYVSLSELASHHHLPLDVILEHEKQIQSLLPIDTKSVTNLEGAIVLVSLNFEETQRRLVRAKLSALLAPTPISEVADGWDISATIQDLIEMQQVRGDFHVASGMFIPTIYTEQQRVAVDQHFMAQGILSLHDATYGIGGSSMGAYVQESFPSAVVLKNVVLDLERMVNPLVPVLQSAATECSFVDLRLHLPEALIQHEDDMLCVLNPMLKDGILVLSNAEALYVSREMISSITTKRLPSLIQSYAKECAVELDAAAAEPSGAAEDGGPHSKKGKSKKSKKSKLSSDVTTTSSSTKSRLLPLSIVAQSVLEAYPDLADIQASYSSSINNAQWDDDDESSPILDLCRAAFYNTAFQDACQDAVDAELERLRSSKKATSVITRKDGAAKTRSVEASFEATFSSACHFLILQYKVLEFCSEALPSNEESSSPTSDHLEVLRQDFLCSSCADFASRITQYCLFRNELEGDVFSFGLIHDELSPDESLQPYCQPIDWAIQRVVQPFLSCIKTEDHQKQLPLPTLRKVLSGSLGVTLARLWSHCGAFDGATKPGNVQEFMEFVQENCLSICGIPFTQLTKKLEKQYLFTRRQALASALTMATDAKQVLELTIMMLMQQIRSLVVCGPYLTGPILEILCRDKKMPEGVSTLLRQVAVQCENEDSEIDAGMVEKVKGCGLSRDIGKHEF